MTAPKRVKCELCDKTMFIGKCPHNRVELDYKSLPPQTVHKYIALTKEQYDQLLAKLERAKAALRSAKDFAQDTLARANQAIETDCDKCDYQCQGCIRAIDDAESMKHEVLMALAELGAEEVRP